MTQGFEKSVEDVNTAWKTIPMCCISLALMWAPTRTDRPIAANLSLPTKVNSEESAPSPGCTAELYTNGKATAPVIVAVDGLYHPGAAMKSKLVGISIHASTSSAIIRESFCA